MQSIRRTAGFRTGLCLLLIVAGLVSPVPAAPGDQPTSELPQQGDTLPRFRTRSTQGTIAEFPASVRGKAGVVVLFATWCPVCRRMFADFRENWQREFGRTHQIVAVGQGHNAAELKAYAREQDLPFALWADPDRSIYRRLAEKSVPWLLVFDRRGRITYIQKGYSRGEWSQLRRHLAYAGSR